MDELIREFLAVALIKNLRFLEISEFLRNLYIRLTIPGGDEK
jgi:hypothetical protein